jgi:6-phospho 3-hexuloisomerase
MKLVRETINDISKQVMEISSKLKEDQVEKLLEILLRRTRVFVVGAGRSRLIARAFAMRLMHLDFVVHVVGETTTPSLRPRDILLAVSGSGETTLIVTTAKMAKDTGATIVALTSHPDSSLGRLADLVVEIPGRAKIKKERSYISRQIKGEYEPLTPMGTLFEVATFMFLEGIIAELMARTGKTEEEMRLRHATIE